MPHWDDRYHLHFILLLLGCHSFFNVRVIVSSTSLRGDKAITYIGDYVMPTLSPPYFSRVPLPFLDLTSRGILITQVYDMKICYDKSNYNYLIS